MVRWQARFAKSYDNELLDMAGKLSVLVHVLHWVQGQLKEQAPHAAILHGMQDRLSAFRATASLAQAPHAAQDTQDARSTQATQDTHAAHAAKGAQDGTR